MVINHKTSVNDQCLMTIDLPERETRLEPATYSLEGCRSTN